MTNRAMWLLNHGSARKFDIPMLKKIGIQEIFTPKTFPNEINFRSSNVDYSFDTELTIPKIELDILNQTDWYRCPEQEAWKIANKYFDVAFFIAYSVEMIESILKNFKGAIIWRAFGLDITQSYSKILNTHAELGLWKLIESCQNRFWMGYAYDHLGNCEEELLKKNGIYLPLGMSNCSTHDQWNGSIKKIFFVCPDIGFNSYYKKIYDDFKKNFSDFDYAIGGSQPLPVPDNRILGFVPNDVHQINMQEFCVMYYHSNEPNHIHYHPFEAIRSGMPLIFMAGGLLDRLGGKNLPGRCKTIQEARTKIKRIFDNDKKLIHEIRESQVSLLEPMKPENCEKPWEDGFKQIFSGLEYNRSVQKFSNTKTKRIAVILPIGYKGGTFRGAKLIAQAVYQGSRAYNEPAEVLFFYFDDSYLYPAEEFEDLFPGIVHRPFRWKNLKAAEARRAMRYAGYSSWEPTSDTYQVPDDGINYAYDCDLWLIVSDRVQNPVLPIRPIVHMVYDYLQRRTPIFPHNTDTPFLVAARSARKVFVTTNFTKQDAINYAGLDPRKIIKVPMLSPSFTKICSNQKTAPKFFLWTTNASPHKNHEKTLKALKYYYHEFDGQLNCVVTGVGTANLLKGNSKYSAEISSLVSNDFTLQSRIEWKGELHDKEYQKTLYNSAFLWHAAEVDNGTFSVIEAASLGVPALSSDYPAMREIDTQFSLNLAWMDAYDPKSMAAQLKQMELTYQSRQNLLPSAEKMEEQSVENLAPQYWEVLRTCL